GDARKRFYNRARLPTWKQPCSAAREPGESGSRSFLHRNGRRVGIYVAPPISTGRSSIIEKRIAVASESTWPDNNRIGYKGSGAIQLLPGDTSKFLLDLFGREWFSNVAKRAEFDGAPDFLLAALGCDHHNGQVAPRFILLH